MEKDTEKNKQEKDPIKTPIFKRKSFIIGSIAFVALLGAVVFSITLGKYSMILQCIPFQFPKCEPCTITVRLMNSVIFE